MSDTTDPELCSLIINVCKPYKNFDFPEAEEPFRFVWFEEFPWFVIFGGRIEPVACLVFYFVIKMWENLCKKHIKIGKQQ